MRIVDVIAKKRDKQTLTEDEIKAFVAAVTNDDIPDYQVSALLMAIYLNGMSREEVVALTMAMAHSGQMMDLSQIADYAVDKHSSGGVGDKTSLVVLPLVASFGVPVAKMSGRGLGFSGGTLDKLESIPGFNVALTDDEFEALAHRNGLVLAGQTADLAPADGKLYALRDVTATVSSIPLIAASIMSKKLASGANGIVLDVKCGSGAFMKTLDDARELAQIMVQIGTDVGRDVVALLSNMSQPLGYAVGNAVEVREAIATLHNDGPVDFTEHCLEVAAYMLSLYGRGNRWADINATRDELRSHLDNGSAWDRFKQMVDAQGGDVATIENPDLLPQAKFSQVITASQGGYVQAVDAELVAKSTLILGAGRQKKGDPVDHAVGVDVRIKISEQVEAGQNIGTIYANDEASLAEARDLIDQAIKIGDTQTESPPLFFDVIDGRLL